MAEELAKGGKMNALHFLGSQYSNPQTCQILLGPSVMSGNTKIVESFLDSDAGLNKFCSLGKKALAIALECLKYPDPMKMVTFLVEKGSHVNRSINDVSPLIKAVFCNPDIVNYRVRHGANINEVGDDRDNTPLTAFCSHLDSDMARNSNMVATLLIAGANPNMSNNACNTALHLAAKGGNFEICCKLIKAGSHLEARAFEGSTPLL
ncbi:ankyrin [Plakobranchus ocellatus]|uniref:Ankyrin n=1 Tax=Plakobranchus ocellatus TaxID=259542 RepID=A0AAV4AS07_9GAST|nr:ankyrin [Plakobranchus ocellatus]